MPALPFKHFLSIVISILLIFAIFITAWRIPSVGMALGLIFLLFGLTATSYTILQKNRKACRQGKISQSVCIKNILLEISAILFTMVLAALAGRYLSRMATENMNSHPVKLIAGIGIGILIGWAIGLFIKFVSSRFTEPSSGS
jgi:hypothetical protein